MEFVLSLLTEEQRMLRESILKMCKGKLGRLEEEVGETNIVKQGYPETLG